MNYLRYLETASLEDKLEILKKKWGKLAESYQVFRYLDKSANYVFYTYVIDVDPTKNKQYLQWIITKGISSNVWKNKTYTFKEDLNKLKEDLEKYHLLKTKNKLKPEHKDINKIKTDEELWEIVNSYEDTDSKRDKDKALEEGFYKNKDATLILNNNTWKVVIPHTEAASCFFGRNTRWCTASKNNNMFHDYDYEGDLYIILHKPTNRRWQFHFETYQFMDEKDNEVPFKELRSPLFKDIRDIPKIKKAAKENYFLPLLE